MIALEQYAQVKDNYCIAYFGPEIDYVLELVEAKKVLENKFGIKIYISCRDEYAAQLVDCDEIVPLSKFSSSKHRFAYVRDLRHNGIQTPAQILFFESGISTYKTNN